MKIFSIRITIVFTSILLCFSHFTLSAQTKGTLTDSDDGRTYKTINIGNQWWMAENLNYFIEDGSWCYNNDSANCAKYGRLYNWETAMRACPRGWHIPTKAEFEVLIGNVGDENTNAYNQLIKKDTSGFKALLGGSLNNNDIFNDLNINGYFWTSSKDYLDHIWYLNLYSENSNAFFYFSKNVVGLSVRCLKN